ncbi:T9SS type A sorting domain-containing protein [Halocola ammonii]
MKTKLVFSILLLQTFTAFSQLIDIESVEFDPVGHRWFVSNGNSIATMQTGGEATNWGNVPTANYGMEIFDNHLFAIHNNSLEIYDLELGSIISDEEPAGAQFLNGMASNGEDMLWISDFGSGEIYAVDVSNLENPEWQTLNVLGNWGSPNGLWYSPDEELLYAVEWGANASVFVIDPFEETVVDEISTGLGNIDGIVRDEEGNFYLSSWSPQQITRYTSDFSSSDVIVVPGLSNPADIDLAWEIDTLAIPNSGSNEVIFVGITPPVSVSEMKSEGRFEVYPNPITSKSRVEFYNRRSGHLKMALINSRGQVEKVLCDGNYQQGGVTVYLAALHLKPGTYFLTVRSGHSELRTKKVVVAR